MTRSLDWTQEGAGWPNRTYSRFVEAGGCRWHVQRAGAGPRVLLIHGTGASTHSWAGLFPLLAARCDVLAVDLPGHAFTRCASPASSSLPGMAAALKDLLGQTGFQPDHIVGHSAGAAIAIRLAATMKNPPKSIVGLNGALRPLAGIAGLAGPMIAKAVTFSSLMVLAISRSARDQDRVARLIRSTGSEPSSPYLEIYTRLFASPSHVRGAMRMMASWDVSGILLDLDRAGCPLVLITGDRDHAVAPAEAADLAGRVSNVRHIPLRGLGHLAHEEDPGSLADAIFSAIENSGAHRARARA
jgi:magnesium chelatase accessory protein